ncbi:hypothetical protein EIN_333900 [Entamoeba invadens IP1]|uniref:Uncharacterized protein n=1 Tax=Entamoeba invadens IP1 TaxID=370355 RepID=A0A0A1UG79_ENTIV|nr:hypothetical protein EIN_333900 [Entamoeba invadens IP1]ELP92423.1 hypothetical protein EIN_333900 [Entamoeba invadens IP1]|eukprot:XP_004259194.1 hypothetical protein EIN_333900 [Entamoeba invadens IP1]
MISLLILALSLLIVRSNPIDVIYFSQDGNANLGLLKLKADNYLFVLTSLVNKLRKFDLIRDDEYSNSVLKVREQQEALMRFFDKFEEEKKASRDDIDELSKLMIKIFLNDNPSNPQGFYLRNMNMMMRKVQNSDIEDRYKNTFYTLLFVPKFYYLCMYKTLIEISKDKKFSFNQHLRRAIELLKEYIQRIKSAHENAVADKDILEQRQNQFHRSVDIDNFRRNPQIASFSSSGSGSYKTSVPSFTPPPPPRTPPVPAPRQRIPQQQLPESPRLSQTRTALHTPPTQRRPFPIYETPKNRRPGRQFKMPVFDDVVLETNSYPKKRFS